MPAAEDGFDGVGPGSTELVELLEAAQEAAAAGAQVLSARLDPGFADRAAEELAARTKSGEGDWVTAYDLAAEQAVREVLGRLRPRDEVSGEEGGTVRPADWSGLRWSVDPLDGTTNFIRGIVYWATSVAVVDREGNWLAGAVNAPALGKEYTAVRGMGSWLTEGGVHRRLSGPPAGRGGRVFGTGFSYDPQVRAGQLAGFLDEMVDYADLRRLGSAALDLCLVAEGALDGYAEQGLHEHDWAAGALVAEEAGLEVRRPHGSGEQDLPVDEERRRHGWVRAAREP